MSQQITHFQASNPYQFVNETGMGASAVLTDFRIRRAREAGFAITNYGEELSDGLDHLADTDSTTKTDTQDLFLDLAAFVSAAKMVRESFDGFIFSSSEIKDRLRTSVFEMLGAAAKVADELRNRLATLTLQPGDPVSEFVNAALPRMAFFSQQFHTYARATLAPSSTPPSHRDTPSA